MAKKKKQSVLDYDPLAWLNESDNDKKNTDNAANSANSEAHDKTDTSIETQNDTTEEGFGFFTDTPVETVGSEAEDGYGFFTDEEPLELDKQGTLETQDEGFGFFSNEPIELESSNSVSNDEGFGFFADEETDEIEEHSEVVQVSKEDVLSLGSELTIKTVSDIKLLINQKLSADEEIILDAEEMIKIDTAGLQLLFSLKKSLEKTGHHIKWAGTSTVVNDSAEIIGMPLLSPKSKDAGFGFFEENMAPKDAEDGSSGFF